MNALALGVSARSIARAQEAQVCSRARRRRTLCFLIDISVARKRCAHDASARAEHINIYGNICQQARAHTHTHSYVSGGGWQCCAGGWLGQFTVNPSQCARLAYQSLDSPVHGVGCVKAYVFSLIVCIISGGAANRQPAGGARLAGASERARIPHTHHMHLCGWQAGTHTQCRNNYSIKCQLLEHITKPLSGTAHAFRSALAENARGRAGHR